MRKIFKKLLVPVMGLGLSFTLWSCGEKEDSKIIFDSNEGSPVVESTTTVDTEPVPTKKGYTFEGWYTTVDFTDERVQFPFELGKENITLYAKWKLENYTITYHLDGGTNHASNPSAYTVEDTVTLSNPTNGEKEFEGWYKESTFQTAVTSIAKGSTGNVDLYAKWKEEVVVETYSITYHLDGGTNPDSNPASYKKGDSKAFADASKNGYTFEGWYKEATFKNKVTAVDANTSGNLDLYAKFTAEAYTITYHLDGGVNHKDNPASYTIEDTVTLKNPTKNGYTFDGWYKDANYETKVTEIALGSTGNLELYAKFTAVAYTITYHLDGGKNHEDNPASYTILGTVALKDATKTGYTFEGWYKDANYETKVTEIALGTTGNIDLYAKFTTEGYTITYHLDGGTNHADNPASYTVLDIVSLKDPTKASYTFEGWYKDANYETQVTEIALGSTGNLDLYAKFVPVAYTITYHLDGGVNHKDNPARYTVLDTVSLENPTKEHMSFRGWYIDSNFETQVTEIVLGSSGNKDLYAKFTKIDYTITYHLDGGANANTNPSGYAEGETLTLNAATKLGYAFKGWYSDAEYSTQVTEITSETKGNLDFYAKFEIENYQLTYNLDGGTNHADNPASYTVLDAVVLKNPTKTGYTFDGWYKDADYKTKVTEIALGSTGNLDLYAKFTAEVYTITYHLDEAVNHADNPASYTILDTVSLKDPTKTGYIFEGWYKDADFKTKVTEIALGSTGNLDLYAKLTAEKYTITYHLDGGNNHADNPASYTILDTVSFKEATKKGYTFEGWYEEATFDNKVTSISAGTTGNKNVYAKFVNAYELMYGTWSKDGYALFLELTSDGIIYNGQNYSYTMTDFTSSKITVGNDEISFAYQPEDETLKFTRKYYRSQDDLDPTTEEFTLTKIELADTRAYAGIYYTGQSRTVKDLVIDAYGHVTRFDGADTYQGYITINDTSVTLQYKTNNIGDWITCIGTLDNGVLTLTKDAATAIYVKNDTPAVYFSDNNIALYKYSSVYVLEIDNVDYLATMTGDFAVDNLVTFTYGSKTVTFRVKSLAGTSWGTLESAKEYAGEYTFAASEDILVLDGFGPTNGTIGDAKLNGQPIQYSMLGYMEHMLLISSDGTKKYYSMQERVLTEVTALDGMQGKYVSGSSFFEVSGLGYYIKSNSSYYDLYTYDASNNTINLNGTDYTIYHNGNVLSNGSLHYVKDGYTVETKDFTDYLDKVYVNADNAIKLKITKTEDLYQVVIIDAFTLNGIEFNGTYDAVYVLDRIVFNGVELVLTDSLNLVVSKDYSYALVEFVPEKTLSEKVIGLYVNGNYYVRVYADGAALKVYYGGSLNPYSDPTAYDCTIVDEATNQLQFKYSSYTNAFVFSDADGKKITFASDTTVEYSYRGKEFTEYDDSTVEIVSKNYQSKAGSNPSASSLAEIHENSEKKSWTNIKFVTPLTDDQKNVPGSYEAEVYAWVYGVKRVATVAYTVIEDYSLSKSDKSIYVQENYGKAEIIASGMFTAKHNGVADTVTEDMITLPADFDSKVVGAYTITCNYHGTTLTATLNVNPDPAGEYVYLSGETNTYYGTYFSSGVTIEVVNGSTNLIIDSNKIEGIKSGYSYTINGKDITVKLLSNGNLTLTYTDNNWNEYTTTYAKPKEVDLTKYCGVYTNSSYNIRLYEDSKKLKFIYGSSANPYSDPTSYECTIVNEEAGTIQFTNGSSVNVFTFADNAGVKTLTFASDSSIEYNYRGKTWTIYDDSTVELVGKNYQSKAGTSPSASSLAEIHENGAKKSWSNIKFVTPLTDDQKNTLGEHTAEVYAWVYGKKIVATVSYTVIENYSLSRSNKTIDVQAGYGKAEIIASGMFTAKHNGVADTITEDMITLPDGFDSNVAGTYTITCTYYTETLTATLTVAEKVEYEGVWTTSNTESYVKEDLTFVKNADGTFNITYGTSTTWKNITLPAVGKYVYLDANEYYYLTINATDITLTYERGSTYQYSTYKKQS